ncbi:MAG: Phenylalanyl-tRNA synthetase alpha chain, partial [uncultured Rubellimicrobium sp.]
GRSSPKVPGGRDLRRRRARAGGGPPRRPRQEGGDRPQYARTRPDVARGADDRRPHAERAAGRGRLGHRRPQGRAPGRGPRRTAPRRMAGRDAPPAPALPGDRAPRLPGDRGSDTHLRRDGLRRRRRPAGGGRLAQLRRAQHRAGTSRPAGARHLLHGAPAGRQPPAPCPAHPHEPRPDPRDAGAGRAAARDLPRPRLPRRLRPDPLPHVPSGRGPRHRPRHHHGPAQMDPGGVPEGVLRGGPRGPPLPRLPLPLHGTLGRGRHPLLLGQRHPQAGRGRQLAGDPGLRHGPPQGPDRRRHRPRPMAGLRLRHGHRPSGDAEIRHPGPAGVLRERPALAAALRLRIAGGTDAGRGPEPL